MIGFAVDLSLLSKAMHSAVNNDADVIEMKLTQKPVQVPGGEDGETENKPYLCITSRVGEGKGFGVFGRGTASGAEEWGQRDKCCAEAFDVCQSLNNRGPSVGRATTQKTRRLPTHIPTSALSAPAPSCTCLHAHRVQRSTWSKTCP